MRYLRELRNTVTATLTKRGNDVMIEAVALPFLLLGGLAGGLGSLGAGDAGSWFCGFGGQLLRSAAA